MSHATTKHVFGSFRPGQTQTGSHMVQPLKLACLEIWAIKSRDIKLSKQRTTKALIRLCSCTGWSAPLLFAYDIRHIFSRPDSNKRAAVVSKFRTGNYLPFEVKLSLTYGTVANTVMILSFRTDRPGQTVQTQIRLLLGEQTDQGLHCLPFRLHSLDSLLYDRAT